MTKNVVGLVVILAIVVGIAIFVLGSSRETGSDADRELIAAAKAGDFKRVEAAVAKGANVNFSFQQPASQRWFGKRSPEEGSTALHFLCKWPTADGFKGVQLLVEKGANVNTQSSVGNTPLMLAAGYLSKDSMLYLLEHGADPHIKNMWGSTATDFADKRMANDLSREMLAIMKKYDPGTKVPGSGGGGGGP